MLLPSSPGQRLPAAALAVLALAPLWTGCGWAFRVRERAGVMDDTPRSLTLRCGDAPLYFAARETGILRKFGPVQLECVEKSEDCKPQQDSGNIEVSAGAWLYAKADVPAGGAAWSNGGLCLGDSKGSNCKNKDQILDLFIECAPQRAVYRSVANQLQPVGSQVALDCSSGPTNPCTAVLHTVKQVSLKAFGAQLCDADGKNCTKAGEARELAAGQSFTVNAPATQGAGKETGYLCEGDNCSSLGVLVTTPTGP